MRSSGKPISGTIFKAADERFSYMGIMTLPRSEISFIEAQWREHEPDSDKGDQALTSNV